MERLQWTEFGLLLLEEPHRLHHEIRTISGSLLNLWLKNLKENGEI
jgi:hypothetical protein